MHQLVNKRLWRHQDARYCREKKNLIPCVFKRGISRNNTCEWNYPTTGLISLFWRSRYLAWYASIVFYGATTPNQPGSLHYRGFTITLGHATLGRTPLDKREARRRDSKRQISMTPVGFESAIPASERPKTQALERAATAIRYIILPISSRTDDDSQY